MTNSPLIFYRSLKKQLTMLLLRRRPKQLRSFNNNANNFIKTFFIATNYKEQLTFASQPFNCTNAQQFKIIV
jgi:hypothetical protein